MKIGYYDVMSLASTFSQGTFVFIGEDYPFAAAKIFSMRVSKDLGLPVEFYSQQGSLTVEDTISFYGSQTDPFPLVASRHHGCRIIAMEPGKYTDRSGVSKLLNLATVVEVPSLNEKTISEDLVFALSLARIPYTQEVVKQFSQGCPLSNAAMLQVVEYTETNGGLIALENGPLFHPLPVVQYSEFKDAWLFRTPSEASDLLLRSGDAMGFITRLLNEMAMYLVFIAEDQAKTSTRDIAKDYGQNEWFLKNRLLPRLRTMGRNKILSLMGRLGNIQKAVLAGETVDPALVLSSTFLLVMMENQ